MYLNTKNLKNDCVIGFLAIAIISGSILFAYFIAWLAKHKLTFGIFMISMILIILILAGYYRYFKEEK